MAVTVAQIDEWIANPENEYLDFEELVKNCAALANERSGKMILGVTNKPPRRVVGSQAFKDLERTKLGLVDRLHLRIDADVVEHPDGRVIVFQVPSRPIGMPIPALVA